MQIAIRPRSARPDQGRRHNTVLERQPKAISATFPNAFASSNRWVAPATTSRRFSQRKAWQAILFDSSTSASLPPTINNGHACTWPIAAIPARSGRGATPRPQRGPVAARLRRPCWCQTIRPAAAFCRPVPALPDCGCQTFGEREILTRVLYCMSSSGVSRSRRKVPIRPDATRRRHGYCAY